jgi:hypothetical protein
MFSPSAGRNRLVRALDLRRRIGTKRYVRHLVNRLAVKLLKDPTLGPPPCYLKDRADEVYGEAFRKAFEFLVGTGIRGDILEFGTFKGYTARLIATLIREFRYPGKLYLFDSFGGLPEIGSPIDQQSHEVAANKVWFQGQMALPTGIVHSIRNALQKIIPASQLVILEGYYEETVGAHLPASKAALIHIDCDLYSSTKCVLEKVLSKGILQDGCVIMFDDFNANRANPLMGERRALAEVVGARDDFRYSLFFSYGYHGQAFFIHALRAIRDLAPLSCNNSTLSEKD